MMELTSQALGLFLIFCFALALLFYAISKGGEMLGWWALLLEWRARAEKAEKNLKVDFRWARAVGSESELMTFSCHAAKDVKLQFRQGSGRWRDVQHEQDHVALVPEEEDEL